MISNRFATSSTASSRAVSDVASTTKMLSTLQKEDTRNEAHLHTFRSLFKQYMSSRSVLTESESEAKLYQMLPLFCKVFDSCRVADLLAKFSDVSVFCQQISCLMVREISKRASNQSTEAASLAIVKFLEFEPIDDHTNGWILLNALNILANGDASLIQVMSVAAVPSTLVKCLYLFFDLPVVGDKTTASSSTTHKALEKRESLQKIFAQLLVKLCSYPYPAEELARMDDLTLLFSAITSPCPTHNTIWRKNAAEILTTISRYGLTDTVISYIHSKGCMALCVVNMQRLTFGNPLEIVEMFVTVFCFLKDSSQVSQMLLDDFKASQGYTFLTDFLLKFDSSNCIEVQTALRNLLLMISALCMCGYKELRPLQIQISGLYKMQNFHIPKATSHDTSVRNISAFQVLQIVFQRSNSASLCSHILDIISRIYHSDNINYFLLESENTLSQFAECIHLKESHIQAKYFELVQFVVFELNFVPCKELISLSLLIKNNHSTNCTILCMRTLLNILRYNNLFKDVYREIGIIEVLVTCLNRYIDYLMVSSNTNENENIECNKSEHSEKYCEGSPDQLGKLTLENLTILLNGNNKNGNAFREYGGASSVHELVQYPQCRLHALSVIRELILCTGGDDDLLFILSIMHTVLPHEMQFKIQILHILLGCLKDSHRTRTIFRKVGGFVYLTSVFVALDGKFSDVQNEETDKISQLEIEPTSFDKRNSSQNDIILLLQMVCQTLATAMRFEPANAKFFHQDMCTVSLGETLRLLGCFDDTTEFITPEASFTPDVTLQKYYHELFMGPIANCRFKSNVPQSLSYVCIIYRLLYSIAFDNFETPNLNNFSNIFNDFNCNSSSPNNETCLQSNQFSIQSQSATDARIVHPGIVLCMLQLLPNISHKVEPNMALNLQMYLSEIIKSLVRCERNQQIMCEHGLAGQLLRIAHKPLVEENHPLHLPMQYILERLAAQALQPMELREFLRLGQPLSCADIVLNRPYTNGGALPLTRIKTLVSMTTPRDLRALGANSLPPFAEMDMSAEGFGCLYLASISPQAASCTGGGHIGGPNTMGGIGSGDRIFPPQSGLSFSTWFCVETFSDPKVDPHSVHLLTMVRTINNPREENLVCLTILLSARDKAIVVSTQETFMASNKNAGDWEPDDSEENTARIWCPDLLQEGQWHHLVIVLNRAVLKNSTLTLYLDGTPMHTQKLHYISQNPGAGSVNQPVANQVFGYIGTPPIWRRYSRLCWKQGVCHLLEDVLNQQIVQTIFKLGPHYTGSLQAPQMGKQCEPLGPLVSEEKVVFGLNAKAVSQFTLVKIRKVYSRADNKSIAKQLGMNSHENATPIKILHNSAGHLAGAGRSLGGVVVGYLGVRVFSPHPVSTMIDTVGGCNVLLGIIAMAQDVESLYASVKALTCVVRSNCTIQIEMDRRRCYQTLGMFFKKKRKLLNSHILHLTFSLVGTVNSGQEMCAIPNITAFQDLLCDLSIWHTPANGLLRSLLEHLLELIVESNEKKQNIKIMRDLQLINKLLQTIEGVQEPATKEILFNLLEVLLGGQPRSGDLLLFGQYCTSKLPKAEQNEMPTVKNSEMLEGIEDATIAKNIALRNRLLTILHNLLFTSRNTVNYILCDDISKVLGMDWLLLFMKANVHASTVVIAVRMLVVICNNENFLIRFRDATHSGGYLRFTDLASRKRLLDAGARSSANPTDHIAEDNSNAMNVFQRPSAEEIRSTIAAVPGFQLLEWMLESHLQVSELYFLLMAMVVGQPVKAKDSDYTKFNVDNVWFYLWGGPVWLNKTVPKMNVCPEAVCVLLGMIRTIVQNSDAFPSLKTYPETVIQLLFNLYKNLNECMQVMMLGDVISALAAVVFPTDRESNRNLLKRINDNGSDAPIEDNCFSDFVLKQDGLSEGQQSQRPKISTHPIRKSIIDFLRVIVMDALNLNMLGKSTPVLDLVLDASPDDAEVHLQIEYQTEIITNLMNHMLTADILVCEQPALPLIPLVQNQNVAPNVFYFTARVVDKLWQGYLNRNPHDIFDFIIKLIEQAKGRTIILNMEQLHHSLNRCILFLLSRTTESIAEQMSVLETLHKIITHRLLIFGAGNHDLEFIGCLTYCLLQLTADLKIILEPSTARNTTWHVNPQTDTIEPKDEDLNQLQGRNLIVGAAFRVWEEIYVCKKPAIEEVFKVTLTSPAVNGKAPDLQCTREQVMESAGKLWLNYVDNERKAFYRVPWEIHNQIQSKIQKVTGGLTRLAGRTKIKKDDIVRVKSLISKHHALELASEHIKLIKDLVDLRRKQFVQSQEHTQRYVYQDWLQSEMELTRQRGLWGPQGTSFLDKWILDTTEGPHRMRKKTMRNDMFYVQYPYRPEIELAENRQLKYKMANSLDSKTNFFYGQQSSHILCESDNIEQNSCNQSTTSEDGNLKSIRNHNKEQHASFQASESDSDVTASKVPSLAQISPTEERLNQSIDSTDSQNIEDDDGDEDASMVTDNETFLRLLEEKEKISYMFRCARIRGLDTVDGLLLFGKEHCYVVDGFTVLKNREIRDIDTSPAGTYEPIIPNSGGNNRSAKMRQCSKFAYDEIREVHKRRYLLQPIALEVFSGDGRNYLLSFPRKVRNKVYQRFMCHATAINDNAQQSVAGQKRTASVEQTSGIFSSLIGETSVTQRWVRGEISNFQYLMHLNTLAGRSYNDLMQYPVFPWILADYDSDELDLNNPKVFRDLSKPMGAQSAERLEQFRKRFKEWDDPHGETPPYHYGTHYSSAMIVCSYLVRLEPFTQHFLRLQGGHFDLADRMFHSIKEAWLSASKFNMADVKELIPEFFYLPEFITNSNHFDLGVKQNGETINDVVLPPWAKQDPREFIRMHRCALECDYVSQNLHLWIDLIFGCKQYGSAAVEAVNVFHHLFYEGNVDIYNIEDPLKKNATIGFINNFGQIPKQLFKKPHPAKKMSGSRHSVLIDPGALIQSNATAMQNDRFFFHNLNNLKPSLQPIKELRGPVGQILQPDKTVFAVEQNKVMMPPTYTKYIAWGFADHSLRVGLYDTDRVSFVSEVATQDFGEILACSCPNSKTIITAGTSSVITIWKLDINRKSLTVRHSLHGHTDAITCLIASTAYNIIVSGSRDGSAILWDMARFAFVRQLPGHVGVVAAVAINDLTGDIATCSATWLHLWSINGDAIARVNTAVSSSDRLQQILCVTFSQIHEWDQQNVIITGSTDGIVRMWSVEYVPVTDEQSTAEDCKCSNQNCDHQSNQNQRDNFMKDNTKDIYTKEDNEEAINDKKRFATIEKAKLSSASDISFSYENDDHKLISESSLTRESPDLKQAFDLSSCKHSVGNEDNRSKRFIGEATQEHALETSKSDTSLADGFVMINHDKGAYETDSKPSADENNLRNGMKWQRRLQFRSKLTMHTSYDRKDNTQPASITSLAVSKDHKTLYVGDARGRIYSWSVTEQPGRGVADHWLKDEVTDQCVKCHTKFNLYERKHHCRNCGQVFCNKCSRFESEISRLRILKPVRVCQTCYSQLRSNSTEN